MARPKEFSEIAALDAAVDCFWQHGYEATSMRDLAASMGISAPSVYNTFGDKQSLFARALELYLDSDARDRPSAGVFAGSQGGDPSVLCRDNQPLDQRSRPKGLFPRQFGAGGRTASKRTRRRNRQTIWRDRGILQKMYPRCASGWIDAACGRSERHGTSPTRGDSRNPCSCAVGPVSYAPGGNGRAGARDARFAGPKKRKAR